MPSITSFTRRRRAWRTSSSPEWRSDGRFRDHEGYDGVFLDIPGTGSHLELTAGGAHRAPEPHPETLLVLYLGDDDAVAAVAARLPGEPVPAANTGGCGLRRGQPE